MDDSVPGRQNLSKWEVTLSKHIKAESGNVIMHIRFMHIFDDFDIGLPPLFDNGYTEDSRKITSLPWWIYNCRDGGGCQSPIYIWYISGSAEQFYCACFGALLLQEH